MFAYFIARQGVLLKPIQPHFRVVLGMVYRIFGNLSFIVAMKRVICRNLLGSSHHDRYFSWEYQCEMLLTQWHAWQPVLKSSAEQ